MDAFEKVLNGLIDSMHKHMAKGNGEKKVSVAKELEKVSEVEEKKEEPKAEEKKESSAFDKFLMQARANKPKPKGTEMNFASKKQPQAKDKKKAK